MVRKISGSALVDYVVPTAVVGLVVGLGVYSMFSSGALATFFGASSNTVVNLDSGTAQRGNLITDSTSFGQTSSPVISSGKVGDVNVNYHQDGSASFFIGSQYVNLSSSIMNDFNEIMETSGTAGLNEEIVKVIEKLITEHADEYPEGDVPLDVAYGQSIRQVATGANTTKYFSEAENNIVQMSVGNHMIYIVKDQQSEINTGTFVDIIPENGHHTIEGYVTGSNFSGMVTNGEYTGTGFEGDVLPGNNLQGTNMPCNAWNINFSGTPQRI